MMPRLAKYAAASRVRGHAITHWARKVDMIRTAIQDGWSTDWISRALNVPVGTVRKLTKEVMSTAARNVP